MRSLELPLERDLFFRKMIHSLAKSLEGTVGLEEAGGYVALVGSEIGTWIDEEYARSLESETFDAQKVAEVLVDLKGRIGGDFYIISVSDEQIVLGNRRCPFGELALGRPSLCQMTSNVFGRISANRLGYSRIHLVETIAAGDLECRVVINLQQSDDGMVDHEFFRIDQHLL